MAWNYSYQKKWESNTMAKAAGTWLPISPKTTREILAYIKNKNAQNMIKYLQKVAERKAPIPYKRFNKDRGHRKGIGPGGYPVKASTHVIKILQDAIANAENKGLDAEHLTIIHAVTHRALSKERKRGKYAHIEIILEEKEHGKKKGSKKEAKKKETRTETGKPQKNVKNGIKKTQEKLKNGPNQPLQKPDKKKLQKKPAKKEVKKE